MAAVVLVACAMSSPARAQNSTSDEELRVQSKALWKRGSQKYTLAKWDEAIALFEEAYEVWPHPKLLFNLCQAHRQKKSYQRAIFFCRAYLRAEPASESREQVVELIDEMQRLSADQTAMSERPPAGVEEPADESSRPAEAKAAVASTEPTALTPAQPLGRTAPPADTRSKRWYADRIGWSLVGVGVVSLGVGGGYFVSASNADSDADSELDAVLSRELRDKADSHRRTGWMATGVGAGLLVAGIVKLVIHDAPDASSGETRVTFAVGDVGVGLVGEF